MTRITLTLDKARELAMRCLQANGCNAANAEAIADSMVRAEADICESHGLFRVPGYLAALKSGKVNGNADPKIEPSAPGIIRMDGDGGFTPLALLRGERPLVDLAKKTGIAALAIVDTYHVSALWQEVESIAEHGLIALAVHASKAAVAPFGGSKPFFGTDPMAFAWPRRDGPPMAFDQATSVRAKGEVLVAARDGEEMEPGVGIGPDGSPTTDPHEILNGALLTFGGYKGASIGLMIELLSSSLIGEWAAYEQKERDNNDGGPPRGGELVVAFDPGRFGNAEGWLDHSEALFEELLSQDGTRLPGDRRLANRKKTRTEGITIPQSLYDQILELT
jgi:delta1-piperideine-2-carboxylate reductase